MAAQLEAGERANKLAGERASGLLAIAPSRSPAPMDGREPGRLPLGPLPRRRAALGQLGAHAAR